MDSSAGPGNDQRRSRFVDQNIVHFIDDRKVELSLDVFLQGEFHVVAQVIEAELVVGAVGDICAISFLAGNRAQIEVAVILGEIGRIEQIAGFMNDGSHRQAQFMINRPHPLDVAARQVIIDGNQVNASAGERV